LVDLSPFWFKEVGLVGGRYPLAAWREALAAKGKALFAPNVP